MIGFWVVFVGYLFILIDEDFYVDDDLLILLIYVVYCIYVIKICWLLFIFVYLLIIFIGNWGRILVYVLYVVYDLYIFNMININEVWFCRIFWFEMLVIKKFLIRYIFFFSFFEI